MLTNHLGICNYFQTKNSLTVTIISTPTDSAFTATMGTKLFLFSGWETRAVPQKTNPPCTRPLYRFTIKPCYYTLKWLQHVHEHPIWQLRYLSLCKHSSVTSSLETCLSETASTQVRGGSGYNPRCLRAPTEQIQALHRRSRPRVWPAKPNRRPDVVQQWCASRKQVILTAIRTRVSSEIPW